MATCPAGHDSTAADYCDVCGAPMNGAVPAAGGPAPATEAAPAPDDGAATEPCPDCGAPRTGRFCEECGYDFSTRTSGRGMPGPPPRAASGPSGASGPTGEIPPGAWAAIIVADRAYHASVVAQGGPDAAVVPFPPYCPERRVLLAGRQVRIGRRSLSRGVIPEIDLAEPPEDPGVSHIHAVLLARSDGTWSLVDPGSTNGTTINDGTDPIAANIEVPLRDGDRVHLGAWTTITLRRGPDAETAT